MLPELRLHNGVVETATVENALAAANCGSRYDQRDIYAWLLGHHRLVADTAWDRYYGFLLHHIRGTAPVNTLILLLVAITTPKRVTQGRINMVASVYGEYLSPMLAQLLQAMRDNATDASIYVPSTGQKSVLDARLPAKVVRKLCRGDTAELSRANTEMVTALAYDPVEALVGAAPAIVVSGKMLLAVEEFVYSALAAWNGRLTPVVMALAPLLRYWPRHADRVLRARLLEPLEKANARAAMLILPELHWLGPAAAETVVKLEAVVNSSAGLVHALQFFQLVSCEPPAELVRHIIYSMPAGLPLCSQWAHLVPEVCQTLQGELYYPTSLIAEDQFVVANTPFVGTFRDEVFVRMFGRRCPRLLSLEELDDSSQFETFCHEMVGEMSAKGFFIEPYLMYVQE